jgi:hypothetical protein
MSSDDFTYSGMTPGLQAYLDHQASHRAHVNKTYGPFREFEKKWEEAGKPDDQKAGVVAMREAHYVSLREHREVGKKMKSLLPEGLVDLYYKAQRTWMCRSETKVKEHEVLSPGGSYKLTISSHSTGEGSWNYTKARIKEVGTMCGPIEVVYRNYGSFPFLFIEEHPNGHDYLICGEDYQGQTIIELDTGERRDYLPKEAAQGHGFCWASYEHSPSKRTISVNGCYWACPYEMWFIDFDNPMEELPVLYKSRDCDEFIGWKEDQPDTCDVGETYEVCTLFDNKREDDLTDEELEEVDSKESEGVEVWQEVKNTVTTWTREVAA